jgi:hypothetical protein
VTTFIPTFDTNGVDIDAPWRKNTPCQQQFQEDPSLALKWDSLEASSTEAKAAIQVCVEDCPVRALCLKDAAVDPTASGVRGGFVFSRGTVVEKDRRKIWNLFGIQARQRKSMRLGVVRAGDSMLDAG